MTGARWTLGKATDTSGAMVGRGEANDGVEERVRERMTRAAAGSFFGRRLITGRVKRALQLGAHAGGEGG